MPTSTAHLAGDSELVRDAAAWRRDFHQHPELLFDVERTASVVAGRLRSFGCDEVVTGVGRTGVVAIIKGRANKTQRVVAIRADMDALPVTECSGAAYASKIPGRMHACGHDGHTAILLGTARALCATRDFAGVCMLIFQPAEEGGGGAKIMIDDGVFERFGVQEVYGLHNWPGLDVGKFAISPGPMMGASDRFDIKVIGKGGHAARPHMCIDALLVGHQIVSALQSIVARNMDPLDPAVVSVTCFHAGDAFNVIPQTAEIAGTVRTLSHAARDLCERRIKEIASSVAEAFGAKAEVSYVHGYPPTINHAREAGLLADVAASLVGEQNIDRNMTPVMCAEDFSFMLQHRPGAFIFLGNGATAGLHHPQYDFNDAALPIGISLWTALIRSRLQETPD